MKRNDIPFNITLLVLDDNNINSMREVSALDTFDGSTKNFHKDGLYSTDTFGIVGTPARDTKYGYINIKIDIIHPVIYKTLLSLKSLYKDIMSSKEFAVWDSNLNDFVKSNAIEGLTGYEFFMSHVKDIMFEERPSIKREQSIELMAKFKDSYLISKILVIPAGLRDIEIDNNGRASSDEINELYYKLLAVSKTINLSTVKVSPEAYNSQRMTLQNTFVEIYDYISNIVEGKKNLMMGKWASRKVFNGTRNVITSTNTVNEDFDDPNNIGINDTCIGLFQTLKALLPISVHQLSNGFLSTVFSTVGAPALLTNKKTLMSERVVVSNKEYEKWLTSEGIEKQINYYRENTIRHSPIKVDSHYLGLLYRGPDGTFKLIHGIDDLPQGRSKEHCVPLTYTHLFYACMYYITNSYPLYATRYPITGVGSVYPSMVYLKTTTDVEIRSELGNDWLPIGEERIAKQFPVDGSVFFNSLAPHSSKLSRLSADFDGDML